MTKIELKTDAFTNELSNALLIGAHQGYHDHITYEIEMACIGKLNPDDISRSMVLAANALIYALKASETSTGTVQIKNTTGSLIKILNQGIIVDHDRHTVTVIGLSDDPLVSGLILQQISKCLDQPADPYICKLLRSKPKRTAIQQLATCVQTIQRGDAVIYAKDYNDLRVLEQNQLVKLYRVKPEMLAYYDTFIVDDVGILQPVRAHTIVWDHSYDAHAVAELTQQVIDNYMIGLSALADIPTEG